MKTLTIIFLLTFPHVSGQETNIWERISEKTWYTENVDIGQNLVFYEKTDGRKKAILQNHGSGTYVISYSEFDVFTKNNQVYFSTGDGLNPDFIVHERLTLFLNNNDRLVSSDALVAYFVVANEPRVKKPFGETVNLDSLRAFHYNFSMDKFLK